MIADGYLLSQRKRGFDRLSRVCNKQHTVYGIMFAGWYRLGSNPESSSMGPTGSSLVGP